MANLKSHFISLSLSLPLRFIGHFPGEPGLAGLIEVTGLTKQKAVQIVNRSALRAHTDPLFKKFQLLKLKQIRHFQILGFMYKFTHGLLPAGFKDYFCIVHSLTSIQTIQEQQVSLH